MYSIGIDIGSTATKGVAYNGSISGDSIIPTGWSPKEASQNALEMVLKNAQIDRNQVMSIIATGYGRVSADFANKSITEITCHAQGAFSLNTEIRTVIDIGGQDSKIIRIDEHGKVIDFIMNDKCAAGTGRFLEVMARILKTEISDFDKLAADAEPQTISSMCTVFAESEIISLLAKGTSRKSIVRGIFESIANKIMSLLGRLDIEHGIAFTGGLSQSTVLCSILESKIGQPLFTSPSSQIAGALGGAVIGWKQSKQSHVTH